MEHIDTVIIGAGQSGMATSYWLQQAGHPHVVLERASTVAPVWTEGRWDSFNMVTPNWAFRMPGMPYDGDDPDGFISRVEVVTLFEDYAKRFHLPVRFNTTVLGVEPAGDHRFLVETTTGSIEARNVIVATGFFQNPKRPSFASALSPEIVQIHTATYRNPEALPDGAVLVVGSAMSGCQIAEEVLQAGRTVYLATSSAGRAPRRYRGRDIISWLDTIGFFDLSIEQMPPGSTRFDAIPHVSGKDGGHTLNLHQFARDGMHLLGRMTGVDGTTATFAPNLHENLAGADGFAGFMMKMIDDYILEHELDVPEEQLPQLADGFAQSITERLDLTDAGIASVIWATGYSLEFSFVKLPVFGDDRFPYQDRGVTAVPGLSFVGLPWMPSERSGFLIGIAEATRHVASRVAAAVPA